MNEMFNLEKAIENWKSELRSSPAFEDGDVAELESHLREEISRLKAEGTSEERAMEIASKEIGEPANIGNELFKTRTVRTDAQLYWERGSVLAGLLPNYLKVAFRNFRSRLSTTLLNVAGLSIGLTCFLVLFLYLHYELSFDSIFPGSERIYRITYEAQIENNVNHSARSAPPIAPALEREFPEVEESGRLIVNLFGSGDLSGHFRVGNRLFEEEHVYFTDPALLEMFSIKMLQGSVDHALSDPGSMIVSKTMAEKLFGRSDPVGESVTFQDDRELRVTGVFQPLPGNTHLRLQALISISTLNQEFGTRLQNSWFWVPAYSYIKLKEGTGIAEVKDKLPKFYKTYMPQIREKYRATIHFQPIEDIHLQSNLQSELVPNSDITVIYLFGTVAFFVIVIACINYMNLSTAQYSTRAREVGIRKVLGAGRRQIVGQYLAESVGLTLVSLLLALLLVDALSPYLSDIVPAPLELSVFWESYEMPAVMAGLLLLVGFLAGSYPSLYLSRFEPVRILKDPVKPGFGVSGFRKGLVTVQFSLSIMLIAGTLIALQQLDFMKDRPLGFDRNNLMAITIQDSLSSTGVQSLKDKLSARSAVEQAAYSTGVPGEQAGRTVFYREGTGGPVTQLLPYLYVDEHFIEVLQLTLKEGRNFRPGEASGNRQSFIINETAAREFGWDRPIGKKVERVRLPDGSYLINGEVVGVVKDFHLRSLHDPIEPVVLMYADHSVSQMETGYLTVRITGDRPMSAVRDIRETWNSFDYARPLGYFFIGSHFNRQYRADAKTATLLSWFAVLAIFIACLGLFGLSAFTAERRTKEIGIRKVLGANVPIIIKLLSGKYLKLMLAALFLAVPVTWLVMRRWLQNFAYHIELGPRVFVLAGVIAIAIGLLTVSYHSLKTALLNPVKSLRTE